jgi:hypothetical protein
MANITVSSDINTLLQSADNAAALTNLGVGAAYITATGSTEARSINDRFADTVNVKDFGAVGDGVADDTVAIQAAEDAATALGVSVVLTFPSGTYAISDSIVKKTNVHWRGVGKLRRIDNAAPTGANFGLVTATSVDNWTISEVFFENVDRTTELGVPLSTNNGAVGGTNACLDVFDCSDWSIYRCNLTKFAIGIMFRECHNFEIKDNHLVAATGKTVAEIVAGTYVDFSAYASTGGIQCLYNGATPSLPSTYYEISGNYVEVPGLDVAISALSQTYDKQPCIVSNNTVRGANCGIQVYRGSYTDAGNAPTYNTGVMVSNNNIYATQEQGVYWRGVVGGQIIGNYFEKCGAGGENGASSACSICLRVNAFTGEAPYVSATAGDVSDDHGILVTGNRIVNHGDTASASDAALLCELNNVIISNNDISFPVENYTTARAVAMYIGNGKQLRNVTVVGNRVDGLYEFGILYADVAKSATLKDFIKIKDNVFLGTITDSAITLDSKGFNAYVENNIIKATVTLAAIAIRNSIHNRIVGNAIHGASEGILIQSGTDLGATASHLSAGSIAYSIRRGSSNVVDNNQIWNCATPFAVSETNGDDDSFSGRCRSLKDNYVDGERYVTERSGGTPPTTFTVCTYIKHDFIPNSSISSSDVAGKYCTASGQYGSTTTATGDTTNTSPVITNVSLLDGYGVGLYISLTGFSGTVKIIDMDTTAGTITVDADASSTNSTVTISSVAPTFAVPL